MKIICKNPAFKPRNPLVAAARFKRAGTHRPGTGAQRQHERQLLRRELQHTP